MIKNERQYVITKAQADKFRHAIEARAAGPPKGKDAKAWRLESDALRAQLRDLEAELTAYEDLRSAKGKRRLEGADLGQLLIQARIARGWSQRELGERVGLHMQKIQDYEATGYARASLTRIGEVLQALGVMPEHRLSLVSLPTVGDVLETTAQRS